MPLILVILVVVIALVLLAYYLVESQRDRTRERLFAGMFDDEEREVSLWRDAADLLQIEALQKRLQQKDIYETNKSLSEYLLLHYGLPNESLLLDIGDKEALDFPKRCAELCLKHSIKAEVCS